MAVAQKSLSINTHSRMETRDITIEVGHFVRETGFTAGMLFVHCPHATAAVFLNENEPGLQRDILGMVKRLVPHADDYEHNAIDDNAAAHLGAILVGNSVSVPIAGSSLCCGTWQQIFLLELDGPRRRDVNLVLMGE